VIRNPATCKGGTRLALPIHNSNLEDCLRLGLESIRRATRMSTGTIRARGARRQCAPRNRSGPARIPLSGQDPGSRSRPDGRPYAGCTRRRVFVEQRPAGVLCRWCSQCRSAADRAARDRNTIRSSQFRRSSAGSRRSAWSSPPHHAVLETPHTAQLRLSGPEADATCEHQRNRADEAVLIGLNLGAGEHLLRDSISDTLCDERVDRFQTRVGTGGEKERKCLQKKTQLGGVRF